MIEKILNILREERLNDNHIRIVGEFESLEEGLTTYLHGESFEYNRIGKGNTYLILNNNNSIVAYYTLKANAVKLYDEESGRIESISCVEIAKFSIAKELKGYDLGTIIFNYFIKPKISHIKEILAIEQIILFSVSSKKVINFYKDLGFNIQKDSKIDAYIKETDNEGCKFMYMYCN